MRIKICGLNPIRDVQICIDLKVDFLGFVFYKKSPRNVNLTEVKSLLISGWNRITKTTTQTVWKRFKSQDVALNPRILIINPAKNIINKPINIWPPRVPLK